MGAPLLVLAGGRGSRRSRSLGRPSYFLQVASE
jgi:hypothetical protein